MNKCGIYQEIFLLVHAPVRYHGAENKSGKRLHGVYPGHIKLTKLCENFGGFSRHYYAALKNGERLKFLAEF